MLESAVLWRDEVGDGGIVKTEEGGGKACGGIVLFFRLYRTPKDAVKAMYAVYIIT